MAKKQAVQKNEGEVEELERAGGSNQENVTCKGASTQEKEAASIATGQSGDNGSTQTQDTGQVSEFVDSMLRIFSTYEKLYIDSKGGVFVQAHGDATEYANPYFI